MANAWEKRASEFGILVCFASFHLAFQLAVKPRRITNSKVLAIVFHRSLLQASTLAKDSKITQNREAEKAKWQAMFLPPARDVATEKHRQVALCFCFKYFLYHTDLGQYY